MTGLSRRSLFKIGCAGMAAAMMPRESLAAVALPAMASDSPWITPLAYDPTRVYSPVDLSRNTSPHFSNWQNALDVAIHQATTKDPLVKLYYNGEAWAKLRSKTWRNQGNSTSVENAIRKGCKTTFLGYEMNVYSTTNGTANNFAMPTEPFKKRTDPYWSLSARIPKAARPAQNADGYMAVVQPDGWVLETMATIVMSNGDIVCLFAGYTNPKSRCDGSAGGRRASLLPTFAGVLRSGEMSSGEIRHALALGLGPEGLAKSIRYPAYTMDRNPYDYAGSIPMGTLLAIPQDVNLSGISFRTSQGLTVAKAAQQYGMYVVDRSGPKGFNILAETGVTDVPGYNLGLWRDLGTIKDLLRSTTKPKPA